MNEFLKEFQRLRDDQFPRRTGRRKRAIVASLRALARAAAQVLRYATTRKVYGFPDDYWDTYPAKIAAVTPEDIMRVAKKYIGLDNLQVVAVGDAAKIKRPWKSTAP